MPSGRHRGRLTTSTTTTTSDDDDAGGGGGNSADQLEITCNISCNLISSTCPCCRLASCSQIKEGGSISYEGSELTGQLLLAAAKITFLNKSSAASQSGSSSSSRHRKRERRRGRTTISAAVGLSRQLRRSCQLRSRNHQLTESRSRGHGVEGGALTESLAATPSS